MAAICHKSWATPLPPSILLSFLPCRGLSKSPGVWAEPAHLLPNILMQFIPSNSFLKCTLVFNVLQKLSVHAEFSHCLQNWYYGLKSMYSSMALKRRGRGVDAHLEHPLPESEGVRTPRDRHHWVKDVLIMHTYLEVSWSDRQAMCIKL